VPRAGLDAATVAAAGAALADEVGFAGLTMGLLAERLGVRTPSLYKHIAGQDDLNRRIAALALDEAADAMGAAIQGYAGRDALAAAARAFRAYVLAHPGRYAATVGITADDALFAAGDRALSALRAVLRSYPVQPENVDHALRTVRSLLHGFATLQSGGGFQWSADVDESFEWLIDFADRGLRSQSSWSTRHTGPSSGAGTLP
jgi:AcrR family transcriptional regulator